MVRYGSCGVCVHETLSRIACLNLVLGLKFDVISLHSLTHSLTHSLHSHPRTAASPDVILRKDSESSHSTASPLAAAGHGARGGDGAQVGCLRCGRRLSNVIEFVIHMLQHCATESSGALTPELVRKLLDDCYQPIKHHVEEARRLKVSVEAVEAFKSMLMYVLTFLDSIPRQRLVCEPSTSDSQCSVCHKKYNLRKKKGWAPCVGTSVRMLLRAIWHVLLSMGRSDHLVANAKALRVCFSMARHLALVCTHPLHVLAPVCGRVTFVVVVFSA